MRAPGEPLSPEETDELSHLLERSTGRSLAFIRGVFAGVATAPTSIEATDWLQWILGREPPDQETLRRLVALAMREYAACSRCLALRVPVVPAPDDAQGIVDFCKGYIRVSQADPRWTRDSAAFALTIPFAWLAGYVDSSALASFAPEAQHSPESFRTSRCESLADDVAALYAHWAEERQKPPAPAEATPRIGRNEPCPCGSGKKYKRCCGIG